MPNLLRMGGLLLVGDAWSGERECEENGVGRQKVWNESGAEAELRRLHEPPRGIGGKRAQPARQPLFPSTTHSDGWDFCRWVDASSRAMSEHDAVNTANATAARAAGWPELTGSPKQTEWAITVRADKIREMEASTMQGIDHDWYREVMLREISARTWIDSRSQPWQARFIGSLTDEELEELKAKAVQNSASAE